MVTQKALVKNQWVSRQKREVDEKETYKDKGELTRGLRERRVMKGRMYHMNCEVAKEQIELIKKQFKI